MSNASVPAERLEALAKAIAKGPQVLSAGPIYDALRALLAEAREEGEPSERPAEFSIPDTIMERVDRVMRESRLKVREYLAKESANLKPLDLNQVYGAPASAGTEGPGLREALEKVTVRMNKVTARWRHTRSIAKAEMDALCNIQLEAEAALARVEGEKK